MKKTSLEAFENIKGKRQTDYKAILSVLNDTPITKHYEVFKRRENTMYNVVSYPTDKAFGIWAWTTESLDRAIEIFNELNNVN